MTTGLVKEFHDRLRGQVREKLGRNTEPTAGVIDSQSVKADAVVGADSRGFDGGKLINGRKRHVGVDTLGLLLGVMVTAADTGDRIVLWADGCYTGSLVEYCLAAFSLVLAIVKRSDDMRGSWCCPSGPTLFVGWTGRRKVQRPRDTGYGFQAVA
ncbi:transposase, partial [Streptomyces sp. NPDC005917]|uniref:transposase n=1 Tax=unclassified Streptomyces TaxID=2593676 RepID=UPI0033E59EDF